MSRLKRYSILAACILCAAASQAQYYSWGPSPASTRWRQLRSPDLKLIYPAGFEAVARRTMWYLDAVRPSIGFGFDHGTMPTHVVMHTRNMIGNGMVMWAPRRMELLPAPDDSYSEPRTKRLAIHEYRHNVQYNNLRRGTVRPLTWLLGEQAAFLGVAQFSIFATEGDAVMAETELSAFGRGLQPSWTMHYRAVGDVGTRSKSTDYWFSGSFRDYVPDHYRLGYQMVRWGHDRFGDAMWGEVARYVARNPQWVVPVRFGLKKLYGIGYVELYRRAFADLNAHWSSLPRVEDSSVRVPSPERTAYTTYRWPQWANGVTIVSLKSDLVNTPRIVRTDADTGEEGTIVHTGMLSSRPVLRDGALWWTEYRADAVWRQRVRSRIVSYDLSAGRRRTRRTDEEAFYPTPTGDGRLAYVGYDEAGTFSIVRGDSRIEMPHDVEVAGLAWDDVTRSLYFTGIDDGGMFLARVDDGAGGDVSEARLQRNGGTMGLRRAGGYDENSAADGANVGGEGFTRLTPSRHITLSDLRAGGGRLYFGSIASGRDEAHAYDLATGTEYRLSTSTYGSFHPSVAADGRVALTTYDRHGYHLAVQETAAAVEQEQRALPLDLVNPPWRRWNVPKMDSMVYTARAAEASARALKPRRFSRVANILRPHSWVPADLYPPEAIDESRIDAGLGATVMSQSLLSDATSWLAYGWARDGGGHMVRGGLSYNGLGPQLDVEFRWGGARQVLYTPLPSWFNMERKPYLSVTTRLSLPMTLGSGHMVSTLIPSVDYNYSNGVIFRETSAYAVGARDVSFGVTGGNVTRGVERLSLALRFTSVRRTALSELQPRWGVAARVGYVTNPTNRDFRNLISASAGVWLPGVVRPHGMRLRAAWQRTAGRAQALFIFQQKELFPRGGFYNFATSEWNSAAVDYQLPVWYPEGGIPGLIYFKRVRVNAFVDVARWRGTVPGAKWNRMSSYGADVTVDLNPLRMPATNNMSVTFTIARPSDSGKPYFNVGLSMPL